MELHGVTWILHILPHELGKIALVTTHLTDTQVRLSPVDVARLPFLWTLTTTWNTSPLASP